MTRLFYQEWIIGGLMVIAPFVLDAQQKELAMDEMWSDVAAKNQVSAQDAAWFKEAKYAMFIHWGLFSQNANRWQGKTYYGIGEWIMYLAKTRVDDYEKIAGQFNPVDFNAREWVQLARDAGMKYMVITAKHHDGFAMFKSGHHYNIVDATPFRRDPMKELAAACKEAGLKLGFYYSQFQDWHEINDWSPDLKKKSFEDYFINKCQPQVKELLTNYGPLGLVWFDTPGAMTKDQSEQLVKLVKKYQPHALINSRIGNGAGDYSTYGDHEIPTKNIAGLWEAVNTSNDSWGFAWYDENWKGPTEIARDLVSVVARGGNFMLNVGPRADGIIPEISQQFLRIAGHWIMQHGEALYGAQPSPWLVSMPWGEVTTTGHQLHLFIFDWKPGEEIWLPGLMSNVQSVRIKTTQEKLSFEKLKDDWLKIQLPLRKKAECIEVITVELEGLPIVDATAGIYPNGATILKADLAEAKGCRHGKSSWMEKFGEWKHLTTITTWLPDTSSAAWTVRVKKPGKYFVQLEYNAWKEADGSEWDLVSSHDTLRIFTTETTGASVSGSDAPEPIDRLRPRFRKVQAGIIEFDEAGQQILQFKAVGRPGGGGIQLHALHLSYVE